MLDAAGLSLFGMAGVEKALAYGIQPLIAMLVGTGTGVGGDSRHSAGARAGGAANRYLSHGGLRRRSRSGGGAALRAVDGGLGGGRVPDLLRAATGSRVPWVASV